MTWQIEMQVPYPPSLNAYKDTRVITAKGRPMVLYYLTAAAKAFKLEVQRIARHCDIKPILGPVEYELELYPHLPLDWQIRAKRDPMWWDTSVRAIDLDNAEKVLLDALNGIAWTDDSMIFLAKHQRMVPQSQSCCILRVKSYERTVLPLPRVEANLGLDFGMTPAHRRELAHATNALPERPF